jgi:DNA-binding response OmpR family regulator
LGARTLAACVAVTTMSSDARRDALTSICICTPSERLLESICDSLSDVGFGCLPAANASAALRLCRYVRVEVLILDLAFFEDTVTEVLRGIAEPDFPEVGGILVLSDPRKMGRDIEALLEREGVSPVDDYLTKPISLEQLHARIRRIIRRRHSRDTEVVRFGELFIDPSRRKVTVGNRDVRLAGTEFTLLRVLASDPTRVFSKDELLRSVWGLKHPRGRTRTLDSHASRLRRKLDPEHKRFVANSWGVGYSLVRSAEDARRVADAEGER